MRNQGSRRRRTGFDPMKNLFGLLVIFAGALAFSVIVTAILTAFAKWQGRHDAKRKKGSHP